MTAKELAAKFRKVAEELESVENVNMDVRVISEDMSAVLWESRYKADDFNIRVEQFPADSLVDVIFD